MRVRAAKFFLRGVNFSCSLIVLSMIATTFSIFNSTRTLPPRNNLPPWALTTNPWPQITLLCISCVSLVTCILVFWGYHRGGYRRAEKVAVYYTSFAVLFFCFSIAMWGIGGAILNQSRVNGNGQDLWGWSCKDNTRRDLFQQEVNYALICRLQVRSLTEMKKNVCSQNLELVTCVLRHRSRYRGTDDLGLRYHFLPILLQASSPKVHGTP